MQDVRTYLAEQPAVANTHSSASLEQAHPNAAQISPDEVRAKIFSQLCATKLWDDGGATDSTLAAILAETLGSQEAAAQAIGMLAAASAKAIC